MIIDTTCSVVERKMKKASNLDLESLPKFFVSDFSVDLDHPVVFNIPVVFEGGVTFKGSATFNDNVDGNFSIDWDVPTPKATPEDIADVQKQLAQTANDPNLTITCAHTFRYEPTPGKVASLADLGDDDRKQIFFHSDMSIQDYDFA